MARLRSWFLRNILESIERKYGAEGMTALHKRLAPRLAHHIAFDRLRFSAALESVALDEAEEVLLAIDGILGDGSGRVVEAVGRDLATRNLTQGSAGVVVGDLCATVARMRTFLEHPFIDTQVVFELDRSESGFELTIGVLGNPRATKILRHFTIGAITAAERFARESGDRELKVLSDNIVDRAHISAHFQRASVAPAPADDAPTMRRIPTLRPAPSLSAEVDAILNNLPPRRSSSDATAAVTALKPPSGRPAPDNGESQ